MSEKISTENIVEQAEILAEAANGISDGANEIAAEKAEMMDDVKALVKAQNAMDNAAIGKPFVPSKEEAPLFNEINALVQAQNDAFDGFAKVDRKELKHFEREDEPQQYDLQDVIDEKIKEEQKDDVLEALKNEIVAGFEPR
jgi:hypothetical protein